MNIKKFLMVIIILFFMSMLSSCTDDEMKPDKPMNLMTLVKSAIGNNDYERFQEFMLDGREHLISQEQFKGFSDISTAGSKESVYRLQEYSNGEMLLIEITRKKYDGEFKVLNVFVVPKEMKGFFNRD